MKTKLPTKTILLLKKKMNHSAIGLFTAEVINSTKEKTLLVDWHLDTNRNPPPIIRTETAKQAWNQNQH